MLCLRGQDSGMWSSERLSILIYYIFMSVWAHTWNWTGVPGLSRYVFKGGIKENFASIKNATVSCFEKFYELYFTSVAVGLFALQSYHFLQLLTCFIGDIENTYFLLSPTSRYRQFSWILLGMFWACWTLTCWCFSFGLSSKFPVRGQRRPLAAAEPLGLFTLGPTVIYNHFLTVAMFNTGHMECLSVSRSLAKSESLSLSLSRFFFFFLWQRPTAVFSPPVVSAKFKPVILYCNCRYSFKLN